MPPVSEFTLQSAFTLWLKGEQRKDGTWKVIPAIRPGVVAWHTPNGGERRDAFEGMRLKQSGVEAGIPDYLFLWGGLFGLEFKKPGQYASPEKGLSASQLSMQPRLRAAGIVALETVDSLPAAKEFCFSHGLAVDSQRIGG